MPEFVKSADGTSIAYDVSGSGPSLVIVLGALNSRTSVPGLVPLLESAFTVHVLDRRGRGDSGDTAPYAVEREVEDVAAVIEAAGGSALVFGHSSGGILSLECASRGLPITKLAVYEPPYRSEPRESGNEGPEKIDAALAAGDRGAAVKEFMMLTGTPGEVIDGWSGAPFWPGLTALAHTLPYEMALVNGGQVPERLASIRIPTLVMDGGGSLPWAAAAMALLLATVPGSTHLTLLGQNHNPSDELLAPVLREFFGASALAG